MMPVMTNSSLSYERSKRTPIHQLIDLDQYPIHDLDSNAGRDLVSKCQQSLADTAGALLPDFVRPDALSRMATEAEQLVEVSHRYDRPREAFLGHPRYGDGDLDEFGDLKKRLHENRYNQVLNYQIPNDSDLRALYLWPDLTEFVRRVLNRDNLFPSQCPHLALTMKIAFEGDQDGWHYDPNDGVVTLQLQTPDEGGVFEYAPYIRSDDDENYQGVARLFDSPDTEATRLRPAAGTFMLFNGSRSMHRVCQVDRTRRPRVVAIFSYDGNPDMVFSQSYVDLVRSFPRGRPQG